MFCLFYLFALLSCPPTPPPPCPMTANKQCSEALGCKTWQKIVSQRTQSMWNEYINQSSDARDLLSWQWSPTRPLLSRAPPSVELWGREAEAWYVTRRPVAASDTVPDGPLYWLLCSLAWLPNAWLSPGCLTMHSRSSLKVWDYFTVLDQCIALLLLATVPFW